MKNSMVAVQGVFACNRLMDEKKFAEADALIEHLLSIESGIVGIHRNLMICDRIYCAPNMHMNFWRKETLKRLRRLWGNLKKWLKNTHILMIFYPNGN